MVFTCQSMMIVSSEIFLATNYPILPMKFENPQVAGWLFLGAKNPSQWGFNEATTTNNLLGDLRFPTVISSLKEEMI